MNDIDPRLVATLDGLAPADPAVAPDWQDVVARVGNRRRSRPAIAVPALLAALALLAAPAAYGLHELVTGDSQRGTRLEAALAPVAGSGNGRFVAQLGCLFDADGRRVAPRLPYTLTYRGLSGPVTEARLRILPFAGRVVRVVVVPEPVACPPPSVWGATSRTVRAAAPVPSTIRLCGPCRAGTKGVVMARNEFLLFHLLGGRVTVELATKAHPGGELRGRLRAVP